MSSWLEKFRGKTILITGASSGIGAELARQLAPEASSLILIARNVTPLELIADQLKEKHPDTEIELISLDISNPQLVQKEISALCQQRQIDGLINNAGIVICEIAEKLSVEDYQSQIDINLLGHIWMTQAILPAMRAKNNGWICNVSSLAGIMGLAGYTGYSASKAGLIGYTESLAHELIDSGVDIHLALPSDVDTPQFHLEQQSKPEATKKVSGQIDPISANSAASQILKGIAKNKFEIVVSDFAGKCLYHLLKKYPTISRTIIRFLSR